MRVFKNKYKNISYLIYRLINPVFDPIKFINGIYGYIWFTRDIIKYKLQDKTAQLINTNLFPSLHDKSNLTPFDNHYFHQQIWAFEKILKKKPSKHIDISSTYELSGYVSKITKAIFIDLRPIDTKIKNLKIIKGNILNLPLKKNSVKSLSCLHVIEHIGLGRYGDKINPKGTIKACEELEKVLSPGGYLYLSCPIGKNRICFNSHRVITPKKILEYFPNLELVSFSVVNDSGKFIENCQPNKYNNINYGCGMFEFTKKKK